MKKLLLIVAFLGVTTSCHNVTPDRFFGIVVDCAQQNPQGSAALAQFTTCAFGVLAQNPSVCLSGIVTDIHFTVDEVACVVAFIAQQNQAKVALGNYTPADLQAREVANNWLREKQIAIRNSYQSK
jgi:hypothetical protein